MKPDFKRMSFSDLRAYIVANRTDEEAIHELFINRSGSNTEHYPASLTNEEIKEILKKKIDEGNS